MAKTKTETEDGTIHLTRDHYPETGPWAVLSRLAVVLMVVGIGFASLAPRNVVPHILQSTHLEHFAAFYIAGVSLAAAFPRTQLRKLLLPLILLALGVEALRIPLGKSLFDSYMNLVCDVGGAFGAFVPISIDRFRRSFAPARQYTR